MLLQCQATPSLNTQNATISSASELRLGAILAAPLGRLCLCCALRCNHYTPCSRAEAEQVVSWPKGAEGTAPCSSSGTEESKLACKGPECCTYIWLQSIQMQHSRLLHAVYMPRPQAAPQSCAQASVLFGCIQAQQGAQHVLSGHGSWPCSPRTVLRYCSSLPLYRRTQEPNMRA